MPTTVRYRKYLRRPSDWEQADPPSAAGSSETKLPPPAVSSSDDEDTTATAPMPWRDGQGTLESVKALVRSGALRPFDLVDVGRGWESVGECADLQEG